MSIETRILAVVDVYDALVSDRVYRAAWTPERAFGLLEEESHAYDQTVVAALKRVSAAAAGLDRRLSPAGRRARATAPPRARVVALRADSSTAAGVPSASPPRDRPPGR